MVRGGRIFSRDLDLDRRPSRQGRRRSVLRRDPVAIAVIRVQRVVTPAESLERAVEVEPGDYVLSARVGDNATVDPNRNFTVRVAVGPRVCALVPANIPDPEYPDLTNKPDNPDLFQVGVSYQPDASELGPFTLMSFNAYLSPPFTDLFEFTWELDGQVVAGENGPTILKPYADLPQTPTGLHTVKLTAKGVNEYQDPTEARFNVLPFDGGARSVTCQFQGPS
jgi:hypothetical protein